MFARRSAVVIGSAMFIGGICAIPDADAHGSSVLDDGCRPLDVPSRLPGVNAFFDSAALVRNTTTADASFNKKIVIAIGLTSTPAANVIDGGDASVEIDSIFRVVIAALRPAAGDSALAFRVVLQGGKPLKVKMDRSELCAPQPLSGREDRRTTKVPIATGRVTGRTAIRPPSGARTSGPPPSDMRSPSVPRLKTPRLHIDTTGNVVDVMSDEKDGTVDEETRILWMGKQFSPAMLDGIAVEVWFNGSKTELVAKTK